MDINVMMQYVTYGLALIGVLAFLVSIIVQVIKEMPGLNKIPTSIVALITSLILCPVALIILCTYYKVTIVWYYCSFHSRCIYCISCSNRRMGAGERNLGSYKI